MWVILVDHSGSMGDGFKETAQQGTFLDRRTQQTIKLQAAVESVLIELTRLPARSDIILCGFTDSARLLYRGQAGDKAGFETALRGLVAGGGTDIAAALDGARAQVAAAKSHPPVPGRPEASRILLITDGLSDLEKARQAARRCAQDSMPVDAILIDPTDEAKDLAGAVTGEADGRWHAVSRLDDFLPATAAARSAMEAQQAEEGARAVAAEAAEIHDERAAREDVLFRASYPGALTGDAWQPLVVHVYTERMEEELKARLAELASSLGPRPRRAEVSAGSAIKRHTELEIQPLIEHVRCRPSRMPVIWDEQLEEARFEIRHDGPARPGDACRGDVLVLTDGLVIARIPVSFHVAADGEADGSVLREQTATMISEVFGCYSRKDAEIVRRFRAAYQALGIHLFVDTLNINSGEPWRKVVLEQIEKSDLFQLFWSQASAESDEVRKEWQHALEVARARPSGTHFIRPVFWTQPPLAPPEPLEEIDFWYFDPQTFGVPVASPPGPAGTAPWSAHPADVRFPVITLHGDPDGGTVRHIQDALSAIVPFLDEVTGLRYYPPATYLVDEAIVTGLRPAAEPDARLDLADATPGDELPELPVAQERLVADLDRLLRIFHDHGDRTIRRGRPDAEHIREQAEEGFARNVRLYLVGRAPRFSGVYRGRLASLAEQNFPVYARLYVRDLLALVEEDLRVEYQVPGYLKTAFELKHPGLSADDMLGSFAEPVPRFTAINHRYREELSRACQKALRHIQERPEPPPAPAYLRLGVPALGLFRYRGAAHDLGDQARYIPSGTPAVYVCAAAFERLADRLREDGMPEGTVPARTAALLTATLVHEHMHAALATGLDHDGLAAGIANTEVWAAAGSLNEALAAWAQRHFFRDDPGMFDECSRYIAAGDYPAWPYRGADALEAAFRADGISAIRQAVRMLRASPAHAQREFDTLLPRS